MVNALVALAPVSEMCGTTLLAPSPERVARRMPRDLRDVLDTLMTVFAELHDGSLEPRVGSAMGSVAGTVIKLYEVSDFEARLAALERNSPHVRQHW
jgi:hypothetical protein